MQLDGSYEFLLQCVSRFVGQKKNLCAQERALLIHFQDLETLASFRDQIETSVGILLRDGNYFSRTANLSDTFIGGSHHAEGRIVGDALPDHLFVLRFKDVQRQGSARKEHDVEREQGKKSHAISRANANLNPIVRYRLGTLTCRAAENTTRTWNSTER